MAYARPTRDEALKIVSGLVSRYRGERKNVEDPAIGYTESQVRTDYINPLLSAFGWDVGNLDAQPFSRRDVIVEQSVELSTGLGRPDYTLRFNGRVRHVVEAKKPSVVLSNSSDSSKQVRRYGFSYGLPVGVLTNFAELVFFDSRVPIDATDGVDVALIPRMRIKCDEYETRFDDLWEHLSFDFASTLQYETLFSWVEPPRGGSVFDRSFLQSLRKWRTNIARNIYKNNPALSQAEVGRRTQRLLNAIIFLRVCEDRDLIPYEDVKKAASKGALLSEFKMLDRRFNAHLFTKLEQTHVDVAAIRDVVDATYWPNTVFSFALISPTVLAWVYEQYLSERVSVSPSGKVVLEERPELVHAGGVVTTPGEIVDELVAGALDPKVQAAAALDELRVLDMACGSGVFLLRSFEQLLVAFETQLKRDSTLSERSLLARATIYGVDIDPEATEVARLSLSLAVLRDATVTSTSSAALPDLTENIVVGNSVIDNSFDTKSPAAGTPSIRSRVNPFSWAAAFPSILGSVGKFDVIVGNPPFSRIQTLADYFPEELAFIQVSGSFKTAQADFDLYMIFLERALELMGGSSRLAMVVPNRILSAVSAAPLRQVLRQRVERVVNFGVRQMFPGRTTYTCLLFIGDNPTTPPVLENAEDPGRRSSQVVDRNTLTERSWPGSSDPQTESNRIRMRNVTSDTLGDIAEIFVGVQTSKDEVFFLRGATIKSGRASFTDFLGASWEVESGILRAGLVDRRLAIFGGQPEPDRHAIMPYDVVRRPGKKPRAQVFDVARMRRDFPLTLDYLESHRELLESRSVQGGNELWRFGRAQSLWRSGPKIIVRVLSIVPQYVIDRDELVVAGGGDGGPYYLIKPRDTWGSSWESLIAALSHPAVDALVSADGKVFQGGYASHRKAFIAPLPVPRLTPAQDDAIRTRVIEMQNLEVAMRSESDSLMRASLIARRASLRGHVDSIVGSALGLP